MATTMSKVLFTVIEIVIFIGVAVVSIFMRHFLTPFQRGFFRDDESLMHPYHSSTITNVMLYTVGFLTPGAVILVTEAYYIRYSVGDEFGKSKHKTRWILQCYNAVSIFILGAASTHLLTNIPKYSVGRLRPHFFDVCKPDWSMINVTTGFIETDICTGTDEDLIKEARLSFPSGHSSMAMYCAVIFILYLQKRITWNGISLLVPLLQLIAFSMAFYTCLTRISDYKHHWSDVLAGGLLGVVIGCLTVHIWIKKNFRDKEMHAFVRSDLPHTYVDSRSHQDRYTVSSVL